MTDFYVFIFMYSMLVVFGFSLWTLFTSTVSYSMCKMANVKQQLAALVNSSGPSQKDRIEKYDMICLLLSYLTLRQVILIRSP